MKMYFAGMPTAADVKKLYEVFGEPKIGQEITHKQISEVIECSHRASRYRVIVSAWRRSLLNEHNIELGCIPTVGYKCLNAEERVNGGVKGFQQGTRKQLRSARRAGMAITDDSELQRKQLLMSRTAAAILATSNEMMRQIAPPPLTATQSMPRPQPRPQPGA